MAPQEGGRSINPREQMSSHERERRVDEFLTRGVDVVYPSVDALRQTLLSGRKLNAYMGIDPTAPDMHVGHVSQLQKLRRLQELGHNVTLLIGDFTAMIGDPTDKSAARTKLTREKVLENAATYKEQAAKILDFDDPENPISLRFNSEWLNQMNFADVLELASEFTVQQMSERDMFQKRFNDGQPVHLSEFLYPAMQGWDSVKMDIDIEIGGSDQIFNMMVGRDLMRRHKGKEKFVVGGSLLVDPGGKKIGKTEGNMVTVNDEPEQMFHKIMMWGDQISPHALELCTRMPMEQIREMSQRMGSGELNLIEAKKLLAQTMVTELHSQDAALRARAEYDRVSSNELPQNIREMNMESGKSIIDVLVESGYAESRSEARRLIQQNGVRLDDETVTDAGFKFTEAGEHIFQVGKMTQDSYRRIKFD